MGQYWKPVIQGKEQETAVGIENYLDGGYVMAKLTEQAWFDNDFVNAVVQIIFKNPSKVAWIGDYGDDMEGEEFFKNVPVMEIYNAAWNDNVPTIESLKSSDFTLDNLFLINHDTKEFIDCNKYKAENEGKWGVTHPVPLLTAIGNGLGGGDFEYHVSDKQQVGNVGIWAWNTLELSDVAPTDYREVMYHFIEDV